MKVIIWKLNTTKKLGLRITYPLFKNYLHPITVDSENNLFINLLSIVLMYNSQNKTLPCWEAICKGVNPSPSDSFIMNAPFSESNNLLTMLYLPYLAPKCKGLSPLWFFIFTHAPSRIRLSRLLMWPPLLA